jgi:hypothetical protein
MKRKNKKLKIKKAYSGDFMTAETSSSMYESGRAAAEAFQDSYQGGDGGGAPATTQTTQAKKDTGARGFLDTTSAALNLIGKTAFDVSGLGLAVKAAQKVGPKVRQVLTPKQLRRQLMQDYQVHLQLHTLRNHNQLQLHTQVEIVSLLLKNQLKLLHKLCQQKHLQLKSFSHSVRTGTVVYLAGHHRKEGLTHKCHQLN